MGENRKKNIVLGVCGGIAAYKVCDLVRLLVKGGHNVDVIMTRSASQFVTPLTLQTLTCNPVYAELFTLLSESQIGHISLADRADALVVVPATANVIGKVAAGIADDLLTTTIMATTAPVLFVPSMNTKMWENPIVRRNTATLREHYGVMEPASGELACGVYGAGRLPEVDDIRAEIEKILSPSLLAGKKLLVSAGPTVEEIDPVRFVSNYSSGRMGFALAAAAYRLGAEVTLVAGPVSLPTPYGVRRIDVRSAADMHQACLKAGRTADIVIMAAAVADYRPVARAGQKIKKDAADMTLPLTRNADILAALSKNRKRGAVVVGFAAETTKVVENARKKLTAKKLDYIVANDVTEDGSGFGTTTNRVTIVGRKETRALPLMSKDDAAAEILTHIARGSF